MIAHAGTLDQGVLVALRDHDPVVRRYRTFFAHLDWRVIPEQATTRPRPGLAPHPTTAYIKALLIKLCEHKEYITHLRTFLGEHPLLVLEIGFRPVRDPTQPYGFDVERPVPCARWLRHWQQHLDNALLQALLCRTVHALQAEIPVSGQRSRSTSSISTPGWSSITRKRTFPTATTRRSSLRVTLTVAWASRQVAIRCARTAR